MDVSAKMQLFDLKTKYQFQTTPGICNYNMPLYDVQVQPGNQSIASFPVYQGFMKPVRVNGMQVPFYTQREIFFNIWPNYIQPLVQASTGDGGSTYQINLPFFPAIPGHVDISGIVASGFNIDPPVSSTLNASIPSTSIYPAVYFTTIDSTGANTVVADSGQFLLGNVNYGMLMRPGNAPYGNVALNGGYNTTTNTVNYKTGLANLTFTAADGSPLSIPEGNPIQAQCYFIQQGWPTACLFFNNTITLMSPPDKQYLVELDAYLTPAAFLSSGQAIPFGYMCEYIARGAARKIMADTGDTEQLQLNEGFFREQQDFVWVRSQRQFTATRTETIFSQQNNNYNTWNNWSQNP